MASQTPLYIGGLKIRLQMILSIYKAPKYIYIIDIYRLTIVFHL